MRNRYEALLILDTAGKDDSVQDLIEKLEGDFKKEGAHVEQVQKMDRRNFSYSPGKLTSGYYTNFVFTAEPTVIDKLKGKFRLDPVVYKQHYQKLSPADVVAA
jgi:small subunit ribosomal protein S6